MSRILVIDPSIAGVSGDMILSALLDIKPELSSDILNRLRDATESCVPWVERLVIRAKVVHRHGFRARHVVIDLREREGHRHGGELIDAVKCTAKAMSLSQHALSVVHKAAKLLIESEAAVHGESPEAVHLHETGSADTVVDIVGVAALFDALGPFSHVYTLPIAVGGGRTVMSHGVVTSPAPATLEILRSAGLYMVGGPEDVELATPTGVALIAAMDAKPVRLFPSVKPIAIGYGAGSRDLRIAPNILRVIIGEEDHSLANEEVVVLETDVDDVTGELLGHTIERVMEVGALDVSVIPSHRKRGRPGYLVRVLTKPGNEARLARVLIEELGTLGVRILPCSRLVVPQRRFIEVKLAIGDREYVVRVKVSRDSQGRVIVAKPEYRDLERVSRESGLPLRIVAQEIMRRLDVHRG